METYSFNYGMVDVNGDLTSTVKILSATPVNENYEFRRWRGDVPTGHETDNPLTLTYSTPATKHITAVFDDVSYYNINAYVNDAQFGSTAVEGTVEKNRKIVTAVPNDHYLFRYWKTNDTIKDFNNISNDNPIQIVFEETEATTKSLTAYFQFDPHLTKLTYAGGGIRFIYVPGYIINSSNLIDSQGYVIDNSRENSYIVDVEFGSEITAIADKCFQNSIALTAIHNTSNILKIGKRAFYNTGLKNFDSQAFAAGGLTMETSCFMKSRLQTATIGPNVYDIPSSAFRNCTSLASLVFDNLPEIETIGDYAFFNTAFESTILYYNTITDIGQYAFQSDSLVTLYFGKNRSAEENVPRIESTTFSKVNSSVLPENFEFSFLDRPTSTKFSKYNVWSGLTSYFSPAPDQPVIEVGITTEAQKSCVVFKIAPLEDSDAKIQWGDGEETELTATSSYRHSYAKAGKYKICVSSNISAFGLDNLYKTTSDKYFQQYVTSVLFPDNSVKRFMSIESTRISYINIPKSVSSVNMNFLADDNPDIICEAYSKGGSIDSSFDLRLKTKETETSTKIYYKYYMTLYNQQGINILYSHEAINK